MNFRHLLGCDTIGLIQDIQYLVIIILNNVTNFHVSSYTDFLVDGRSLSTDLPSLADSAVMRNLRPILPIKVCLTKVSNWFETVLNTLTL